MVTYHGYTYLFYSANRYSSANYAIGYAICHSPRGPCHRLTKNALLAKGGRVDGPGGPDAFVGKSGALRMAYAAWDRGHVGYPKTARCRSSHYGCNQRRLHVAALASTTDGCLSSTAAESGNHPDRHSTAGSPVLSVIGSATGLECLSSGSSGPLPGSGVSAPSGTRTPNPLIKSQLLCQLS